MTTDSTKKQLSRQAWIVNRLLSECAHKKVHPIIDYSEKDGLTLGIVFRNPDSEELRTIQIIDKKVKFLDIEPFETEKAISTRFLRIDPDSFELSPRTKEDLLQIVKEIQSKAKIDEAPRSDLFNSLLSKIGYYFYHPDERVRISAACWTIMTYMFPLFNVVPNWVLQGIRASGKSTMAELAYLLAWNPTSPSMGLRSAPLFRTIENIRPTVIIDATKIDIKDPEVQDIFEVVEPEGVVYRCVGDDNIPTKFHLFSPKIITVRNSVAFSDKSIETVTVNATDPVYTKRRALMRTDKELRSLACGVLRSAVCNWREVHKSYFELEQDDKLNGRRFELWRPLLAVCKIYSPESYEKLLSLAHEDAEHIEKGDVVTDVENALVGYLVDWSADTSNATEVFALKALTSAMQDTLGNATVRNYRIVQSALKNIGVTKKTYHTSEGVQYQIDLNRVREVAGERKIVKHPPPQEDEIVCPRCERNIKKKGSRYIQEYKAAFCPDCAFAIEFLAKMESPTKEVKKKGPGTYLDQYRPP
jgi:hypothetical protein